MSMKNEACRKKLLTLLLVFVISLLAAQAVFAANPITKAKKNVHTEGTFQAGVKGKKYLLPDGTYLKNTWALIDGKVYSFKKNGVVKTGWFTYNNHKYYADETGSVSYACSLELNGVNYYFLKNGARAEKCWITLDRKKYYVDENGVRAPFPANGVKVLFIGDSRTHGMYLSMPVQLPEVAFIYKDSSGYDFLVDVCQNQLPVYLKESPGVKVVFAHGVNDLGNVERYITYYQSLQAQYPQASFYYMSANPVKKANQWVNNKKVLAFNKIMKQAFKNKFIKTYTFLKKDGYESFDGIHYTFDTYQKLYKYVLQMIRA